MTMRTAIEGWIAVLMAGATLFAAPMAVAQEVRGPTPIVIGQSFSLASAVMEEDREINIWLPPGYNQTDRTYPVIYLLDGGVDQDFHHITGLAQLGSIAWTMRDVIVVGVASKDRRRELTFPTNDPALVAAFPTSGRSEQFRRFLEREVMPIIANRYRGDGTTTLMGESNAGLFVVETFLRTPTLFDHYIAVSPSLWWDGGSLADEASELLQRQSTAPRSLWLTIANEGGEMQVAMDRLVQALTDNGPRDLDWTYEPRPNETHATIYHDAALTALRRLYPRPAED